MPAVQRQSSGVEELQSSAPHDPSDLAGRDVLVVGGGASAFDLLDPCFTHGARRVVWVYRSTRWFMPTRQPKAIAGSVRPFAKMQASGMSAAQQSAAIGVDLLTRYVKFGLQSIEPDRPPDVLQDQLIPGQPPMLAHFGSIERVRGQVDSIAGRRVTLSDGTRLELDPILWGTGYATDLRWFDQPQLAAIRSVNELCALRLHLPQH